MGGSIHRMQSWAQRSCGVVIQSTLLKERSTIYGARQGKTRKKANCLQFAFVKLMVSRGFIPLPVKSLSENSNGSCFCGNGWLARREEGV
jgi:hypothetical protein